MSNARSAPRLARLLGPLLAAAALGACGESITLPPAGLETEEDTITLYALTGTPVSTPSGYSILSRAVVRTDRSTDFDFAVDFRTGAGGDTTVVLLPRGALGFAADGGLQSVTVPFDSLLLAPETGYVESDALAVGRGSVVVAASRRQACNFGILRPFYAKMRVEDINRDPLQRSVTLRIVVDPNCGYRGLAPGIPNA